MGEPDPRPSTGWRIRFVGYAVVLAAVSMAILAVVALWFALQLPEILDVLREGTDAMEALARAVETERGRR